MKPVRLTFTVINDLTYDQRMQRICRSLANAGFIVNLVGRKLPGSVPLKTEPYTQKRLSCTPSAGKAMYIFFNIRLLFYLLFHSTEVICAIDLDTILPCYLASRLKRWKRVYDAHELFTEQKEIVSRPGIHKFWLAVEKFSVKHFQSGYTVNTFIRDELKARYNVDYEIIRNLPALNMVDVDGQDERFILYQGAVNEGRSFETLIPAMKEVDAKLVICGEGNFSENVRELVKQHKLEAKVEMKGYVKPDELKTFTPKAYIAVTIFEKTGLNQYYSLANRFFDFIMACVPQVCVGYPEYKAINDLFDIALLVEDTQPKTLSDGLNKLLQDEVLHTRLKENCRMARQQLNWKVEEIKLLNFYKNL